MDTDRLNRWLTLIANIGVLIGIFLLVVELRQNATMMEAQIWNDRTSQGIDLFMGVAESSELSEIDLILREGNFPDDPSVLESLTPIQRRQYYWFLRAQRFRVENMLAQQQLGLIYAEDPGPVNAGKAVLQWLREYDENALTDRLEKLIDEAESRSE